MSQRQEVVNEIFHCLGLIVYDQDIELLDKKFFVKLERMKIQSSSIGTSISLYSYYNLLNKINDFKDTTVEWLDSESMSNIFGAGKVNFSNIDHNDRLLCKAIIYGDNYQKLSQDDLTKLLTLYSVSTIEKVIKIQQVCISKASMLR